MTAPAPEPYRTRLTALFAAGAPSAVILRRGPKTHWRLICWDLKTDTVTPGQWMKAAVVRLWDLSPSGDKLIYWAAQYHASAVWQRKVRTAPFDPMREAATIKLAARLRKRHKVARYLRPLVSGALDRTHPRRNMGTWTAVSVPPYFTALAIWPAYGHWTGGGVFHSEEQIFLHETYAGDGMKAVENVPIPKRIAIHSVNDATSLGIHLKRSALGPWYGEELERLGPAEALVAAGFTPLDFVHAQASGDLLFGAAGRVYRLPDWQGVPAADYAASARLLADLRDMRFEQIPAPAHALHW